MRKHTIVKTDAGSFFASPRNILPLADGGEILVAEADRYIGHPAYVEAEGIDVGIEHVVGTLKRAVPKYREMRAQVYTTNEESYEITRLRHNLIRAYLERQPELFTDYEKENFDDCLYRADTDFSDETYRRLVAQLRADAEAVGFQHVDSTYRGWLTDTMHPLDEMRMINLAHMIGSDELEARAWEVYDPSAPKGQKPIYFVRDIHATGTGILAEPKGEGKGSSRKVKESEEIVHPEFPEIYEVLKAELAPLRERSIIQSPIRGVEIIDEGEKRSPQPRGKGLPRRVITISRGEEDEAYRGLGRGKPKSRAATIEDHLREWRDLTGEIYDTCFLTYSQPRDITLPSQDGGAERVIKRVILNRIDIDGVPYVVPNYIHTLIFISPLFDYDGNQLIETLKKDADLEKQAIRTGRKSVSKKMRRGYPEATSWWDVTQRFYRMSPHLQAVYRENEFILDATRIERAEAVVSVRESLADLGEDRARSLIESLAKQQVEWNSYLIRSMQSLVEPEIERLKALGREIPPEISMSNSFVYALADKDRIARFGARCILDLLEEIFDFYGADFQRHRTWAFGLVSDISGMTGKLYGDEVKRALSDLSVLPRDLR